MLIRKLAPAFTLSDHKNKVVGITSDESYLYTCGPGFVPEGYSSPVDTVFIYSKEHAFSIDGMLVGFGQDIRCVGSDANWIFSGGGGGKDLTGYRYSALRVYDKKTQLLHDDWGSDEYWVTSVLSDGVHLFAGTSDGSIDVYDAATLRSIKSLYRHDGWAGVTRLGSDDAYLYSAASGKTIVLWDKKKLELARSLDGGGCMLVDLCIGNECIVAATDDGHVLGWTRDGYAPLGNARVRGNGPNHVAAIGDGIAVGGGGLVVQVLSSPGLQELRAFTTGESPITALHADASFLYVGHQDGSVGIFDMPAITVPR